MGFPINSLLACLSLEFLECGPFKQIIYKNSTYLRNIDVLLLIHSLGEDLLNIIKILDNVDQNFEFAHVHEMNKTQHMLDILSIQNKK